MGSKAPSSYFILGPTHQVYIVGLLSLLEKKLLPGGWPSPAFQCIELFDGGTICRASHRGQWASWFRWQDCAHPVVTSKSAFLAVSVADKRRLMCQDASKEDNKKQKACAFTSFTWDYMNAFGALYAQVYLLLQGWVPTTGTESTESHFEILCLNHSLMDYEVDPYPGTRLISKERKQTFNSKMLSQGRCLLGVA